MRNRLSLLLLTLLAHLAYQYRDWKVMIPLPSPGKDLFLTTIDGEEHLSYTLQDGQSNIHRVDQLTTMETNSTTASSTSISISNFPFQINHTLEVLPGCLVVTQNLTDPYSVFLFKNTSTTYSGTGLISNTASLQMVLLSDRWIGVLVDDGIILYQVATSCFRIGLVGIPPIPSTANTTHIVASDTYLMFSSYDDGLETGKIGVYKVDPFNLLVDLDTNAATDGIL